jgi:hypothetical protein
MPPKATAKFVQLDAIDDELGKIVGRPVDGDWDVFREHAITKHHELERDASTSHLAARIVELFDKRDEVVAWIYHRMKLHQGLFVAQGGRALERQVKGDADDEKTTLH